MRPRISLAASFVAALALQDRDAGAVELHRAPPVDPVWDRSTMRRPVEAWYSGSVFEPHSMGAPTRHQPAPKQRYPSGCRRLWRANGISSSDAAGGKVPDIVAPRALSPLPGRPVLRRDRG